MGTVLCLQHTHKFNLIQLLTLLWAKPIIAVHSLCEINVSPVQENVVCKQLTLI